MIEPIYEIEWAYPVNFKGYQGAGSANPLGRLPLFDDPGRDQQIRIGIIFTGFQITITIAVDQIIRDPFFGCHPNRVQLTIDALFLNNVCTLVLNNDLAGRLRLIGQCRIYPY